MSDPIVLDAKSLSEMAKQLVRPLSEQIVANLSTPEVDELEIPDIDPTPPVANTNVNIQKDDDPLADAYDDQERKLIAELSCPRLFTTRGKNGRSYTTNLTSQALQTLRDERKNRNQFRHQL